MNIVWVCVTVGLLSVAGLQGYARFAPVDPVRRHVTPMMPDVGTGDWPLPNGTRAARDFEARPEEVLARFDRIVQQTPRTRLVAGGVEERQITYVTRSAFWGFPDFTSVAVRSDGASARLEIFARPGIGGYDWGVNASRVAAWLDALGEVASGS